MFEIANLQCKLCNDRGNDVQPHHLQGGSAPTNFHEREMAFELKILGWLAAPSLPVASLNLNHWQLWLLSSGGWVDEPNHFVRVPIRSSYLNTRIIRHSKGDPTTTQPLTRHWPRHCGAPQFEDKECQKPALPPPETEPTNYVCR